jgi:hypothetical protein
VLSHRIADGRMVSIDGMESAQMKKTQLDKSMQMSSEKDPTYGRSGISLQLACRLKEDLLGVTIQQINRRK